MATAISAILVGLFELVVSTAMAYCFPSKEMLEEENAASKSDLHDSIVETVCSSRRDE